MPKHQSLNPSFSSSIRQVELGQAFRSEEVSKRGRVTYDVARTAYSSKYCLVSENLVKTRA